MTNHIVGIRFRNSGKVSYYDADTQNLALGTHVLVNSDRGLEYGTVMMPTRETELAEGAQPFPPIARVATPDDDDRYRENLKKERTAYKICREKIAHHGLAMKLVEVEYNFDRTKILFYFTADGRIDFRELVKDLASEFRTRIELRQIGVRDEAKLLGGFGICGREFCCSSYMNDFAPVSIKMAKEQNLSLNPVKISGACGRLMCCLKNEEETYEYLNSQLPNIGTEVTTIDGLTGTVSEVSVLRQRVKVTIEVDDEKELRDYSVNELKFQSGHYIHEITADDLMRDPLAEEGENLAEILKLEAKETGEDANPETKEQKKQDRNRQRRHRNKERNKEQRSFSNNYYKDQRQEFSREGAKEQKEKLYSKNFKGKKRNFSKKSRHKGSQDES